MVKASWGNIDGNPFEAELEEYEVYDGDLPPKGVYRFKLTLLRLKTNSNGDPMLNGRIVIAEPPSSKKAQYNGYGTWFNLNVTKQGAPWVNNFLSNLVPEEKSVALRKAFWGQKVMLDKNDPPNVVSIGAWKFKEGVLISADCKMKLYEGTQDLDPKTFLRPTDLTPPDDDAPADEADEDEGYDEGYDEEETAEETDDEYNVRAEELEEMERPALLKAAKALGISVKRGTSEDDIIEAILEAEFPEDEDEESEEEPDEDEEDEVEEEEEPEDEDEEEPEPEEPKRTARRRPAKTAAKTEEPPAPTTRTRTGRRRKTTEPPF